MGLAIGRGLEPVIRDLVDYHRGLGWCGRPFPELVAVCLVLAAGYCIGSDIEDVIFDQVSLVFETFGIISIVQPVSIHTPLNGNLQGE